MSPKLFIDVTQLVHWTGNMTGIPRVMNELAIRFRQEDPRVKFVVWVKEMQALCEIDLDTTLAYRGQRIVYLYSSDGRSLRQGQHRENESRNGVGKSSKESIKAASLKVARRSIVEVSRVSPRLTKRLVCKVQKKRMANYKKADFHKGDTLFIPWGEWWDPNFTECLVRHHRSDGLRLVQVIHDVGPTVQPQFFEQIATNPADYNAAIVPIADLVLTVSKNTKDELSAWLQQNNFNIPPIKVFRLGDDITVKKPVKPADEEFKRSGLRGNDFLLMVGTIEIKKNHLLLYYVYKLAKVRGIKLPKFVIAGRRGWMSDSAYALLSKDPEVKDSFIFQLDKSDEELSWLYAHCLFTVLPSLYEGWGIPIAESVARGVPCLASNFGSMNEVAEGYVTRFCPVSTDECLAAIQEMLDPAILKKAREHVQGYKQFSWDDSFNQVSTYLKEL